MSKRGLTFTVELEGGALRRLEEAILYVCDACENDQAFGLTRLNKILFEADFQSYQKRGVPVTGAAYQRLENGPAPKAMMPRLRALQQHGSLVLRETDFYGRSQSRALALRAPDLSVFGPDDVAFLARAIRESWGKTATEVSEQSHRIEWKTRSDGDPIPYEAAWLSNAGISASDREKTEALALEHGW